MKNKNFALTVFLLTCTLAKAEIDTMNSLPYTPSWQARHYLQLLVDHADLALPVTHWPLPAAAVFQALADLPKDLSSVTSDVDLDGARQAIWSEIQGRQQQASLGIQLRNRAEGLTGFAENYMPGSSMQFTSQAKQITIGSLSFAGRLGVRLDESTNGRDQLRLEDSAVVLSLDEWNLQAFSHRHNWGPGWQSSLINGSNAPAWNGFGLQRAKVVPSDERWLNWMGSWNADIFLAKAQDPIVVNGQPQGYLLTGMRLTMVPKSWIQIGFSRTFQFAGKGKPSSFSEYTKAFFGQGVNGAAPENYADNSAQIAGFDMRLGCPKSLGGCALYTQWMGEDAAGKSLPLPYRFMRLWGAEISYAEGRHRFFVEYTNTYVPTPMSEGSEPAYFNLRYTQGYTNGGRWIGASQGGGGKITTLGWMDAQKSLFLKLHVGQVLWSIGSGYPNVNAPHGLLYGMSVSQTIKWRGLIMTPELSLIQLSEGSELGPNKRNNARFGLKVLMPWQ